MLWLLIVWNQEGAVQIQTAVHSQPSTVLLLGWAQTGWACRMNQMQQSRPSQGVFFCGGGGGFCLGFGCGFSSDHGLWPRLQCEFWNVYWLVTLSAQMTKLMLHPCGCSIMTLNSCPPKLAFTLLLFCTGLMPTCMAALSHSAKVGVGGSPNSLCGFLLQSCWICEARENPWVSQKSMNFVNAEKGGKQKATQCPQCSFILKSLLWEDVDQS